MALEELACSFVFELRTLGQRVDGFSLLQLGQLESELKHAGFRPEHLRKLNLPRMQVEPPQGIRQNLTGEQADRKLVSFTQAHDC